MRDVYASGVAETSESDLTDWATSTSAIHNIAIVRQPEQEHTSVLILVLPTLEARCVGDFVEMQLRDLTPWNFVIQL